MPVPQNASLENASHRGVVGQEVYCYAAKDGRLVRVLDLEFGSR